MPLPTVIDHFENEYAFLSNFHPCPVVYDGLQYPSAENAFQAAKCADVNDRRQFIGISARDAKKLGRKIKMAPYWDTIKYDVMFSILRDKFTRTPELGRLLVKTGDAKLIEGNYWHDNTWGHCTCARCTNKTHHNHLGNNLMRLRTMLKERYPV